MTRPYADVPLAELVEHLRAMREELLWISLFAQVRSEDDSKVFARVNRAALRTISNRAREALERLP